MNGNLKLLRLKNEISVGDLISSIALLVSAAAIYATFSTSRESIFFGSIDARISDV
jgi:hypothetical protein